MSQKKEISKFTIQFNPVDPCHQKVIELLNAQGRRKAQFITNAITHYIYCSQTPDISQAVAPYNIKDMIVEAVNLYMKNKEKNADAKIATNPQTQHNSESIAFDELPFNDNDINAIAETMAMFKAK